MVIIIIFWRKEMKVTSRQINAAAIEMKSRNALKVSQQYAALSAQVATEQKGKTVIDDDSFLAEVIRCCSRR